MRMPVVDGIVVPIVVALLTLPGPAAPLLRRPTLALVTLLLAAPHPGRGGHW